MIRGLSSKPLALLASIIAFALLFILNSIAPLLPGDDLLYQLKFPEEGYIGNRGINSLADFAESCLNHYINYNYRIIPHAILQFVLLFPSYLFDLLNSLIFLLIPVALLGHSSIEKRNRPVMYVLLLFVLWCFHPDLSWSYFWTTGSVTYTWLLIPQIYLLSSLIRKYDGDHIFGGKEFLSAVLISTGSENALLGIFAVSLIILVTKFRRSGKIDDRYFILSSLVMLIGGLLMLFSPAMELRRSAEAVDRFSASHALEYFSRLVFYLIKASPVFLLFLISKKWRRIQKEDNLLFVCFTVSILSMFFAPLYELRSFVFPFMVMIMFCLSMVQSVSFNKYLISALLLYSVYLFHERFESLWAVNRNVDSNEKIIVERKGNEVLELDSYCWNISGRYTMCDDIMEDSQHFHNRTIAAKYGLNDVVLSGRYLIEDIHRQIEEEFKNNGSLQSFYELKRTEADIVVYHKVQGSDNYELYLFEAPSDTDIIIVRASKKGYYNFFLKIFPTQIRIHFYDILEMDRKGLMINDRKYFVCKVFNPEAYEAYLFAKYSKEKHRTEGKVFSFSSPHQVTQE